MAKFAIRPRRYADPLDAIRAHLDEYARKGYVVDRKRNPNGKYELLSWCVEEVTRLREANVILKAIVDIHESRADTLGET
jgi:hypothetical protein